MGPVNMQKRHDGILLSSTLISFVNLSRVCLEHSWKSKRVPIKSNYFTTDFIRHVGTMLEWS